MEKATVTLYRWDEQLQRSVPATVKVEEFQTDSVFTSDEIAAILKAVLGISK